ncbi:MAG: hypothetical protein WAK93_10775 [Solirubrobacteraceae bacterium]
MAAIAVLLLLATAPATALADGDPASDVLAAQSLFLPPDSGIPAAQQARLTALVSAAARQGFPVRVALVAGPSDLGSISQLWRMPGSYARFLGQELSLVFHGTLLVVMPNGVGVYRNGGVPPKEQTAIAGAKAPGTGASMATATTTLVRGLAAAAGHPLTVGTVSAPTTASSGSALGGAVAWAVFAAGAVLVALAWIVSLRARPAGRGRHAGAAS